MLKSAANQTGFRSVFLAAAKGKSFEYRFQFQGVIYRKGKFKTPESAARAYHRLFRKLVREAS